MTYSLHGSGATSLKAAPITADVAEMVGAVVGADLNVLLYDSGNQHALVIEGTKAELQRLVERISAAIEGAAMLADQEQFVADLESRPRMPSRGPDGVWKEPS